MRSQKQKNRAPRPFKKGKLDQGWSGGNRSEHAAPLSIFGQRPKKLGTNPPEISGKDAPADKDEQATD